MLEKSFLEDFGVFWGVVAELKYASKSSKPSISRGSEVKEADKEELALSIEILLVSSTALSLESSVLFEEGAIFVLDSSRLFSLFNARLRLLREAM